MIASESIPAPTIHEAELAAGSSGAVQYGREIDEAAAVLRRKAGLDIVIRGNDLKANRTLAQKIENAVGTSNKAHFPHTITAGPNALPHYQQTSGSPRGHTFYETENRKARRMS